MSDTMCSCHAESANRRLRFDPKAYARSRARDFEMDPDEMLGPSREMRFVKARAVVAKQLREMGFSFPEIGRALNRHHSSVMHMLGMDT